MCACRNRSKRKVGLSESREANITARWPKCINIQSKMCDWPHRTFRPAKAQVHSASTVPLRRQRYNGRITGIDRTPKSLGQPQHVRSGAHKSARRFRKLSAFFFMKSKQYLVGNAGKKTMSEWGKKEEDGPQRGAPYFEAASTAACKTADTCADTCAAVCPRASTETTRSIAEGWK